MDAIRHGFRRPVRSVGAHDTALRWRFWSLLMLMGRATTPPPGACSVADYGNSFNPDSRERQKKGASNNTLVAGGLEKMVPDTPFDTIFPRTAKVPGQGCASLLKVSCKNTAYPPDLQDAAVQTVLQQAETLCEKWTA
jgi:hypothetical protein